MKRYYKALTNRINNCSLQVKITLILALVVVLTSIASMAGAQIILHSCNALLYRALIGSLNYSAEDISNKLANIESMANSVISNQHIRKSLIALQDDPDSSLLIQNADNMITSFLVDYYQNYKDNDIKYINFYYGENVSSSFNSEASQIPKEISNQIIAAASKNSGYSCWITDYCNAGTLFLGRDCRRVQNLKLDTLGTVVVSVDINKLVRSSTKSVMQDGDVQYIIYDGKDEIYHSPTLDTSYIPYVSNWLQNSYDILSLGNTRFFCTKGRIENNNWEYICLLPWSQVSHTLFITNILSLLILILAVSVSFLFSRILIRSISSDFGALADKMQRFGKNESNLPESKKDYSHRTDEAGILHQQFDQMVVEIQKLIQQNYINEILTKDAQLKSLESQINPHFLYNALESVNWRAKAIGAKDISDMVQSLGNLLRATLSNKKNNFTIRHELEIVNSYITIQKIRFDEDRLDYREEVSKDILDAELPQMTIQPLIDNAINYAMEVITETCHITLKGYLKNGEIHVLVINNGSQFEDRMLERLEKGIVRSHGIGIGLLNIHQRIQLIYGSDYGLSLYNADDDHAVAEIIIPQTIHEERTDTI